MKNLAVLGLFLALLTSCLSDEEKRLQTDQTYEGEEMFHLSYSLDEHLPYALQSYYFYQDTVNHSEIPGCPAVSLDQFTHTVTLLFGEVECTTGKPARSGKIMLSYPDPLLEEKNPVKMGYEGYNVRGISIEGTRIFHQLDSTAVEFILSDSISNITFTDANRSTSKMSGVFIHEVSVKNDIIQYMRTEGSASGRNLAGRPYHMEITKPKHFSGDCMRSGLQVAESGEEVWVFERTVTPDVSHTINYQQGEDCDNKAQIRLHDGEELLKNQ